MEAETSGTQPHPGMPGAPRNWKGQEGSSPGACGLFYYFFFFSVGCFKPQVRGLLKQQQERVQSARGAGERKAPPHPAPAGHLPGEAGRGSSGSTQGTEPLLHSLPQCHPFPQRSGPGPVLPPLSLEFLIHTWGEAHPSPEK